MTNTDEYVNSIVTRLSAPYTRTLKFFINKSEQTVKSVDPQTLLIDYLRDNGYTGTKYGCGEGGCGACTVVVAEYDMTRKQVKYRTANSCLLLLCSLHCKQVITVEGLGDQNDPHPVQERIAKGHGSQCGFCTPGFVMSLFGLLKLNSSPLDLDIEEAFDGNLCRCTGYRPILESARSFSKSPKQHNSNNKLVDFTQFKQYDPNDDIPFPQKLNDHRPESFYMFSGKKLWLQPVNTEDLLIIKDAFPDAKLISGNTEVGIETKFKGVECAVFVNVLHVNELKGFRVEENNRLEIGANITLAELAGAFEQEKKSQFAMDNIYYRSLINSFIRITSWFASHQIRNFASLAGNISTASPISDLNPILVAANAVLTIGSANNNNHRLLPIRQFFQGYRKTDLKSNEVILSVTIPLTAPDPSSPELIRTYKQAKRKDDDIAIVNACFRVKLQRIEPGLYCIKNLELVYGGLAVTTICLGNVSEKSIGLIWGNQQHLDLIQNAILDEVRLAYSVPGGSPSYRRTLAVSFFVRFWHQVLGDLKKYRLTPTDDLNNTNIDEILYRPISSSSQIFRGVQSEPHIGTTQAHASALSQSCGTAKYLDDLPKHFGELVAYPVLSTRSHAYILSIDAERALRLDGVCDFITYKDVPRSNRFGLFKDEEFFASKEVLFYGQIIGLILADTKTTGKMAADLIHIEYESLHAVLTIEEAIEANSFYDQFDMHIEKGGHVDGYFEQLAHDDDLVFANQCRIGGQEHFYLEPQGCLVVPRIEDDELIVHSSTQNPYEVQTEVAAVLGLPANRVVCKVKRLGGGFGGKETRATLLAVITSVASYKTKRPVRCVLDRHVDMLITGGKHPYWAKYKLRVSRDGFFKACDFDFVSNAGHSIDLSSAVMEKALVSCDNVYCFPKIHVRGRLAKTNIASNTAFRGFGAPQAMMVADQLGLDQARIRQQNMYKPGESTHFNAVLDDWFLPDIWQDMQSDYQMLKNEIRLFNEQSVWTKRGIAIIPTKCGVAFSVGFLNQASANVHIYRDGSVLLQHGGIEMGQGLHTKIMQIAANVLQIPTENIFISETATDKIANGSPTAASFSSDLYGMAVLNACEILNERLKPYRMHNTSGSFRSCVEAAYLACVPLSACGFFKANQIDYNLKTNTGMRFPYFSTGVAISVVELDVLTGDHIILRSDIAMDIGQSLNYAIDIGQIEGAFVQGVGGCTLEETLVTANGAVLTRGPGNYKIPTARDIPVEFNIRILKDKIYKNLKTIKSSKGIGEPPLFLSASVFFALRDAVVNTRKSNSMDDVLLKFPVPCTSENLRMACHDSISHKAAVLPRQNQINAKELEKLWCFRT